MPLIMIYLVVSLLLTAFLWAAVAIAKQVDVEKEKNLRGIIFKLVSGAKLKKSDEVQV